MWNRRLIRYFSDKITTKTHDILTVDLMEPKTVQDILVSIPDKGALWGKGGQFVKTRNSKVYLVKFRSGQFPSLKRIQRFLENEQGRDIKIIDIRAVAPNSPCSTAMLVSAYSIKHVGKLNNALVKEVRFTQFRKAEVPGYENLTGSGHRGAEWLVLSIMDLYIHFLTDDIRQEMDIETEWTTPTDPKDIERFKLQLFDMYGK